MSLPSNVHVSSHPVLASKLAQLRQKSSAKITRQLSTELTSILSVWVSGEIFKCVEGEKSVSAAGIEFVTTEAVPGSYVLVPILRSGLSMVDPFLDLLPSSQVPIHHIGLFREKSTLSPVEYYNKLPTKNANEDKYDLAIVLDPIIATGGTADAVIQTLMEWGVKKVVFVSFVASAEGIQRITEAEYGPGELEIYVGAIDTRLSEAGIILPGVGDLGDRLFSTHLD